MSKRKLMKRDSETLVPYRFDACDTLRISAKISRVQERGGGPAPRNLISSPDLAAIIHSVNGSYLGERSSKTTSSLIGSESI